MSEPDKADSPAAQQILADIAERGLHVVVVPESGERPAYAYSIGLWDSFEQPEVIVFGLPAESATDLLEAVADAADEGRPCVAGSQHQDLLQGYPVRFVAVPAHLHAKYLPRACELYAGAPFPVVQLVWPDKQGRWPWHEGVRQGFRELQPLLDRLPPPPAG